MTRGSVEIQHHSAPGLQASAGVIGIGIGLMLGPGELGISDVDKAGADGFGGVAICRLNGGGGVI